MNLLEPPIWVADFQFMPSEPQHVVVGTSYQQVYNTFFVNVSHFTASVL